ncbi:MAG: thioesterase family protein [Melioribacteraceae bacterium]
MFSSKIKIYFFDCDPAGIIFFASLFKYSHLVYEDFMNSLKTERDYFKDNEYLLPIINAEATYIKPIKVGDELTVNMSVTQLKDSSFELTYSFYKDNAILAKAKTVHVCVKKEKFEKTSIPEELNKHLIANKNL